MLLGFILFFLLVLLVISRALPTSIGQFLKLMRFTNAQKGPSLLETIRNSKRHRESPSVHLMPQCTV